MARINPAMEGNALNKPTSTLVALRRERKTGRKVADAFATPTPIESNWMFKLFLDLLFFDFWKMRIDPIFFNLKIIAPEKWLMT